MDNGLSKSNKIKNFTDLNTWKEGHKLVLMIYSVTKKFPREEMFGLVSQMRRCVVSITSNIAEGFGRQSNREKNRFYNMSQGSITELQNQLIISKDVEYLKKEVVKKIIEQSVIVQKLLNGMIRKIRFYK